MKNLYKKIITFVLIITFIFSPVFAIPARAQWITWDPGNFVPNWGKFLKDYGLDSVAWAIINLVIDRMSAGAVEWINRGFQGSPAYVTDPAAFFGNIGNQVAGQFIFTNPNLNFLCGDMSAKIKLALVNSYNRNNDEGAWRCTLAGVIDNVDDFMGDFEKGGWDGFFELTQVQQNNPIGAYLQAEGSLANQIANKVGIKKEDLLQGKGIMSKKKCTVPGVPTVRTVEEPGKFELQSDGTNKYLPGTTKQVTEPGPCLKEETVTPGSVISDQLNKQLGMGNEKLAVADEFNEIIGSLLTQLISKVLGDGGLGGANKEDPSNNNQILTTQLASSTGQTTTDYFDNPQDTTFVGAEMPDTSQSPTGGTLVSPSAPASDQTNCDPNTDPFCQTP